MPASFFDSNILLYVASSDPVKAGRSEELLSDGGRISVQVLNEVANVARRKMDLSWGELRCFLSLIRGLVEVRPVTVEIHEPGLALSERYKLSIFDAMIAASALHADCDTLWSEDMPHGMMVESRLRILDPFRSI